MKLDRLDGQTWIKMVNAASKHLEERKSLVDSLNVFPVPDGDTGTNMSLTLSSAAKAVLQDDNDSIGKAAQLSSYGALMGARGNSGVILSQLFAGFANRVENEEELDAKIFCEALESGVQTAYKAVMNPVEGTILTVSREAAQAAKETLQLDEGNILAVLEAAYQGALDALKRTPTMLPVLEKAGVVDAGGQGLVYIIEGMIACLCGKEIFEIPTQVIKKEPKIDFNNHNATYDEVLEFQYCTEFIVKKKQELLDLNVIRTFLADKGDCMLVVGSSETSKIHIHTNRPGLVLDFCSNLGSLHEVQIHNMAEQSEEMQMKARAKKHLGLISVAMGAGLVEIFKSLGVDAVINGGQTMNPSIQDFCEAIDSILAEEVIILPNNSNVILAAEQAAKASSKPVCVVPTKTMPEGIGALMAYNAEDDITSNRDKMEEAIRSIVTIELTHAVRDAQYEGYEIKKGQILGLVNGKLSETGNDIRTIVFGLLDKHLQSAYELVTFYYGEDVKEEEAEKLIQELAQKYQDVDFELHLGGQPLYYYLISIE